MPTPMSPIRSNSGLAVVLRFGLTGEMKTVRPSMRTISSSGLYPSRAKEMQDTPGSGIEPQTISRQPCMTTPMKGIY